MTTPPWPPPGAPVPRLVGWYRASDGNWYPSARPPGPGYWLAADGRWYPPSVAPGSADRQRSAERPWLASRWGFGDVWWGALAYVVASAVVGVAIAAVAAIADPGRSLSDTARDPYAVSASVLANVVAFAGVPWLATRRKGLRSLAADFGLRVRPVDLATGLAIGIGALTGAAVVGSSLDHLLGTDEPTSNIPVDELAGAGRFLAFLLAVGVITPIIEELFFRGLVYRSFLKRGAGRASAIAWTTAVFVVPHLSAVSDWRGAISLFASITVLGLAFTLACHWTGGRLGAPIVAHALVNTVAVLVTFLA